MSFQSIIDNAQSISIAKRKKVAQTQARDGTVKTTSIGGQVWEFRVRLPDGPRWTDYRQLIETWEAKDRVNTDTIQINNANHSWISQYQGNLASTAGITVTANTISPGNTLTITAGATGLTAGQFKFKAGDFIQVGAAGAVYSVAANVAYNSNTITTHRPIRETEGPGYSLIVGPAVTWTVYCVEFPNWTLFARDQVSWSGDFVFVEAL